MLTVDVRIQDQIILIIAHLKRERRGTNVSETIYIHHYTRLYRQGLQSEEHRLIT